MEPYEAVDHPFIAKRSMQERVQGTKFLAGVWGSTPSVPRFASCLKYAP